MRSETLSGLTLALAPPVGAFVIRLLGRVLRPETRGAEHVDALYREGRHVIIAFWHGRQLMMPLGYRGEGAYVLISQHRDGELIARIVRRFGLRSVRGSSTRGGPAALRQLIRLGRAGVDLAVTPDGPKGPREVVQMGVIQLAGATGLPIVPLTFGCSKKNTSRAGTGFSCRTRRGAGCSSGASRSGSSATPMRSSRRPSGASWRRRSTRSREKPTTSSPVALLVCSCAVSWRGHSVFRHSREGGNPSLLPRTEGWIPARNRGDDRE